MRVAPHCACLHPGVRRRRHHLERCLEAEVGPTAAPLGEEEVHEHICPVRQAQGVQVHASRHGVVNTAEVHDQLAVDEDPDVVVAAEGDRPSALVAEARVHLEREVEVVAEPVEGHHLAGAAGAPPLAVGGEETAVVVGPGTGARVCLRHAQAIIQAPVHARDVPVPLVEGLLRRELRPPVEDGLPVRPEFGLHQAPVSAVL
mmetsp:Transcript_11111/g.34432  ORF Transcript_11111/g.34432 Transcript_11111/m.34432 type:complete len:202 (+) Transcript_11111:1228-1833(+)